MESFQIRSRAPIVRHSAQNFHERIFIGGESRMVNFEKQVTWLRETETQIEILHDGQVLQQGRRYTDFYEQNARQTPPFRAGKESAQRHRKCRCHRRFIPQII